MLVHFFVTYFFIFLPVPTSDHYLIKLLIFLSTCKDSHWLVLLFLVMNWPCSRSAMRMRKRLKLLLSSTCWPPETQISPCGPLHAPFRCGLLYFPHVCGYDKLQPGGPRLSSYLPNRCPPCVETAPTVTWRPATDNSMWFLNVSVRCPSFCIHGASESEVLFFWDKTKVLEPCIPAKRPSEDEETIKGFIQLVPKLFIK